MCNTVCDYRGHMCRFGLNYALYMTVGFTGAIFKGQAFAVAVLSLAVCLYYTWYRK